jgi:porphobilinogen synthase
MSGFPRDRLRRLRRSTAVRRLVRETSLRPSALVQPMFVVEGTGVTEPIASMPGQNRYSVDRCVAFCERVRDAGVGAVLLFGIPSTKDALGSSAYAEDGVVQRAVASIKEAVPDLLVITDVCLCAYTDHGHCGVVSDEHVDNDATLPLLARTAVSHVRAGADFVAPSDMMDGRVAAIRRALDEDGSTEAGIISYAVKYSSAFFGPFREAANSAPQFGDRRTYQMDPSNAREGVRAARASADEGADILMVKPAMPYLDVIRRVRESCDRPLAAYQVSGEYAMIEAAAERGWLNREAAVFESLLAIRRAGADIIITYYAAEFASRLAT